MPVHKCNKCGAVLVVGENVTQNMLDHRQYVCRACRREYQREHDPGWRHHTGQYQPMDKNRECTLFLGVYVAERVLRHVFKHTKQMPMNNPGFDFICGNGYMVDVKSSCRRHHETWADRWMFHIKRNQIAEYFLCLAFDNRESLNPEHMWLIPSENVNRYTTITISESRISKWDDYKLDVDKVSACCDAIRGE